MCLKHVKIFYVHKQCVCCCQTTIERKVRRGPPKNHTLIVAGCVRAAIFYVDSKSAIKYKNHRIFRYKMVNNNKYIITTTITKT